MDKQQVETRDVRLAEVLDNSTAQALHSELRDVLDSGSPVSLHGSAVERVDTAALQVITALFLYADANKRTITWQSPSATLVRSAVLHGLDEWMCLMNKNSDTNH